MKNYKQKRCVDCGKLFTPINSKTIRCSSNCALNYGLVFDPKTTCLTWRGSTLKGGYGKVNANGEHVLVHRLVWEQVHGPIPNKMDICHHCDNPICGNILHLFLGTQKDNLKDCVMKGRHNCGLLGRFGKESIWWGRKHKVESKIKMSEAIKDKINKGIGWGRLPKLNQWDIEFIKYWLSQEYSIKSIGKVFGVSGHPISDIKNGKYKSCLAI